MLRVSSLLLVGLTLLTAPLRATEHEPVRGIVISCQTWGREWGTDDMVAALREVKALGANWVQIHPYGGIDRDGNVSLGRLDPADTAPIWLARPIAEAHALGLKIAIVPHLAGWRSGWRWRGDITFDTPEKWARFFQTYQTWITTLARLCRDADAFAVGSELDQTVPNHEPEWRALIAAVRAEKTAARLTYGCNWNAYSKIPFWDALDAIGISAYFPLVDHARPPAADELDASWSRLRRELSDFGKRYPQKPIVFLELGYDQSLTAAQTPWLDGHREPGGEIVQHLCLDRALASLAPPAENLVTGAFLWKWFPGENRRENYQLQSPAMRAIIARHWNTTTATSLEKTSSKTSP